MESDDVMHPTHDDLVLHYYGEAGADAGRIDRHLAGCDACRAVQHRLHQTLALVDASGEGEPPPGYEATMWARLQGELAPAPPWWQRLWQAPTPRWAMAAAFAGVAALAFYAGSRTSDVATVPSTPAGETAAAEGDGPGRARLLDLAAGDHLDRAQLVLAELANTTDDDSDRLSAERQRATDLVATNRLMRQSATLAGDESLDGVLDDLERVLVEIANTPDNATAEEWMALRHRLDTQGLVFRVRVVASELRARQQPASPLRKGPTS